MFVVKLMLKMLIALKNSKGFKQYIQCTINLTLLDYSEKAYLISF